MVIGSEQKKIQITNCQQLKGYTIIGNTDRTKGKGNAIRLRKRATLLIPAGTGSQPGGNRGKAKPKTK
jgi:hypothetical protein